MTVEEIVRHVSGSVVCGDPHATRKVSRGFASDLMSDVLTVMEDGVLLVTGLATVQTMRTAHMSDISMVLLVRGKHVTAEMCQFARENDMVVIETPFSMFKASGILFGEGLQPLF